MWRCVWFRCSFVHFLSCSCAGFCSVVATATWSFCMAVWCCASPPIRPISVQTEDVCNLASLPLMQPSTSSVCATPQTCHQLSYPQGTQLQERPHIIPAAEASTKATSQRRWRISQRRHIISKSRLMLASSAGPLQKHSQHTPRGNGNSRQCCFICRRQHRQRLHLVVSCE